MTKREHMILLAYKVALATIHNEVKKDCNIELIDYVDGVIYELDNTIKNIKTKINIEV